TERRRFPSCWTAGLSSAWPWYFLSADQTVDIVGTDADLVVMGAGIAHVVEHVVVPDRIALLVEPHQRPGNDEEHAHRIGVFVRNEGVALARRLEDEVAGGRGPLVLEIGPLTADRVSPDRLGMIVPVHDAGLLGHEHVGPHVERRA